MRFKFKLAKFFCACLFLYLVVSGSIETNIFDECDNQKKFPVDSQAATLVTRSLFLSSDIPIVGHAGIISDHARTIESNPWRGWQGVYYGDLIDWEFNKATSYVLDIKKDEITKKKLQKRVLDFCDHEVGHSYNYFVLFMTNKNLDHCFYCSQLVWAAYERVAAIDICPNVLTVTFPTDFLKSNELKCIWSR